MWNPDLFQDLELGRWYCPFYWFLSYHIYGLSNWVVACMTFDKFIAVCFPLKACTWCTKTRAKISAVLIVLSIAALNAPNLLTEPDIENIKLRLGKKTCLWKRKYVAGWYPEIIDMLFATLSLGLPLLIVVVLNLAIVSRVFGRKGDQERMGVVQAKSDGNNQALVLLFIVTGVFVGTNLPWIIDNLVWAYLIELVTGQPYSTNYRLYRMRPVSYECVLFLIFANSSINFYIYCLGCRKFRKDLVKMFNQSFRKRTQDVQYLRQ
ncbi:probable G-protein coupled receptor 139 [Lineus longissimus]|uniref:probable G-protein coupled receptor 139 n=1 Tax=Lineus longissimus TaxID=88925 RepID=UPI00315DCE6D